MDEQELIKIRIAQLVEKATLEELQILLITIRSILKK